MKIAALVLSFVGASTAFAPALKITPLSSLHSTEDDSPVVTEDATPEAAPEAAQDLTPVSTAGRDGLTSLAMELNPVVKYWDPIGLADRNFWEDSNDATIGWLRQAEIKHGRVAMAAFVGYCVQSNYHFPWKLTLEGDSYPSIDLSPEQQWDAIPEVAKWQIIGFVGFLEAWSEFPSEENSHYMRGGRPGAFPSFDEFRNQIHPMPFDLFDPFGFSKTASAEKKANGLVTEINNGRLAMLGIFSFLSADKIEGSVPLLKNIAIPYDGDVMAPFASNFHMFVNLVDPS